MTSAPRFSLEGGGRNAEPRARVRSGHGDSVLGSNFRDSAAGLARLCLAVAF